MLDIRRVLASAPKKHRDENLNPLMTVWGEALNPERYSPSIRTPA